MSEGLLKECGIFYDDERFCLHIDMLGQILESLAIMAMPSSSPTF